MMQPHLQDWLFRIEHIFDSYSSTDIYPFRTVVPRGICYSLRVNGGVHLFYRAIVLREWHEWNHVCILKMVWFAVIPAQHKITIVDENFTILLIKKNDFE